MLVTTLPRFQVAKSLTPSPSESLNVAELGLNSGVNDPVVDERLADSAFSTALFDAGVGS